MNQHEPIILLVGHCVADSYLLKNAAERAIPGARLQRINDDDALASALADADLLLINRALDGSFGNPSGIDLVRSLASRDTAPPTLLISNFPDAQAEAMAAGARPGFGKRDVNAPETARRLQAALGQPDPR